METNFNFKSQICTDKIQSERLLSLGLKKETADMVHFFSQSLAQDWTIVPLADGETAKHIQGLEIPAWSLHRLIEMRLSHDEFVVFQLSKAEDAFEKVISHIEHAVKEGYFNKEYLL
jgi:hypothetical protein